MEKPKLEFIKFENVDIIATSGGTGFSFTNLGNDKAGDAIIRYNGTTIYNGSGFTSGHAQGAFDACNTALGGALNGKDIEEDLFDAGDIPYKFINLFGTTDDSYGDAASSGLKDLNGVWEWLGEYFQLRK